MKTRNILVFIFFIFILTNVSGWAAEWYVDNAAFGVNDGTSWTNAWESFGNITWSGAGVVAGDTLYISGGASGKTYTSTLAPGASGSEGSPITIQTGARSPSPTGHGGMVTIDSSGSGISISGRIYITVDGDDGAGNINLKCSGNTNYGVYATGNVNAVLIKYVESTNNLYGFYIDLDPSRQYLSDPYSAFIFEYCNLHDNVGDGITGPRCITGRYNTISTGSGSHRDGWEAYGGTSNGYLKIYGNEFAGSGNAEFWGDPLGTIGPIWIYNNIFRAESTVVVPTDENGIRFRPAGGSGWEIYIYNNTFAYTLYEAIHIGGKGGNFSTIDIQNNLIYQAGGGSGIAIESDVGSPTITIDYNILDASVYGSNLINVKGTSYYPSGGSYSTYNTNGNSNQVDLVNPVYGGQGDLRLALTDTNAKDGGTDLSVYFTTDKDGVSRLQGAAWDIGAYESYGANPMSPPTDLRIKK